MSDLSRNESALVEDLREICDYRGKEKDVKASAEIFHELALIFQDKCDDKIQLIQTAVLFNAAVLRDPSNERFQKDLRTFCFEVLQKAGAVNQEIDLVDIAEDLVDKVKSMRDRASHELEKIREIPYNIGRDDLKKLQVRKIEAVKRMQHQIAKDYRDLMDNASKKCIEIMGKPPCVYTIAGMGSLARKEITPYSDFEHVIVLKEGVQDSDDYEDILKYFRWFSVIFHIIVINFKETIIPSVGIPLLNDFSKPGGDWFYDARTPRGISFDGLMAHACKLPLGRTRGTPKKPWTTELIQPVSGMVEYLNTEADMKNGYNLADILTKTCFVSGDKDLYSEFARKVTSKLHANAIIDKPLILQQLHQDLNNLNILRNLKATMNENSFNIKQIIYRSVTLLLSGLGRFHSLDECSCFEIIEKLIDLKKISASSAHLLSFAVAVACEIRLRVYLRKMAQSDCLVQTEFYSANDLNVTPMLIQTVGERSVVTCLEITYALSQFVTYELDNFEINLKLQQLTTYKILFCLKLFDRLLKKGQEDKSHRMPPEDELQLHKMKAAAFYSTGRCAEALSLYRELLEGNPNDTDILLHLGKCLFNTERYDEAITYLGLAGKGFHEKSALTMDEACNCCDVWFYHGLSKMSGSSRDLDNAIMHLKKAMIYTDRPGYTFKLRKGDCLHFIGKCMLKLGVFPRAIANLQKALKHYRAIHCPENRLWITYKILWDSFKHTGDHLQALEYKVKYLNATHSNSQQVPALHYEQCLQYQLM